MRHTLFWFRAFIVIAIALSGALAAYANGGWIVGANPKEMQGYSRQLVIVGSNGHFVAGRDITLAGFDVLRLTAVATDPNTGTLYAGVVLWDRDTSELVAVDPYTGIATPLGDMGHAISSLSFSPDGTLYGISGNRDASPHTLYTINTSTGSASFACSLTGTWSEVIGFDAAGLLYHATEPDVFESFDLATSCTPTTIGLTGEASDIAMGLLFTGSGFLMTDQYKLFDVSTAGVVSNARTLGFTGEQGNDGARGLAVVPADVPFLDLVTGLTFSPNPVTLLETSVATISITNDSVEAATGVIAAARYSEGFLEFTTHSGDAVCTHLFSGYVSCDFGELAPGATETVGLTFETLPGMTVGGEAPVEASVVSSQWDTDPYDNIAEATLTLAQADYGVAINAGKSPAQKGKPLTYNVVASNQGPDEAATVYVDDAVPAGLTWQSSNGATCELAGGPHVVCNLGPLAAGASVPFTLTFMVDLPGKSTITNTVLILSATTDANPANNSATVIKKVVGKP